MYTIKCNEDENCGKRGKKPKRNSTKQNIHDIEKHEFIKAFLYLNALNEH